VERIRKCDFCVFDDRETEIRPNALIELGVAIGAMKPYFYFNFQAKTRNDWKKKRIDQHSQRPGRDVVPAAHSI
jgi:hypothetical protein